MAKEVKVKCKKCGAENTRENNQYKVICEVCGEVTYYVLS
ncbi:hypothetical protein ES703_20170 [subsurface metagenome]